MKWIAGWNISGYLPDMEPFVFETKEEADCFISESKSTYCDDMGQYYEDPYTYWVEPFTGDNNES